MFSESLSDNVFPCVCWCVKFRNVRIFTVCLIKNVGSPQGHDGSFTLSSLFLLSSLLLDLREVKHFN